MLLNPMKAIWGRSDLLHGCSIASARLKAARMEELDPDEERPSKPGLMRIYPEDGGAYEFYSNPDDLDAVREALAKRGWKVTKGELSYKAKNITELTEEQRKDVEEFLNFLDDMDDTHRVHATV